MKDVDIPRASDPAFWLRECMEREARLADAREAGKDVTGYEQQLECARLGLEIAVENAKEDA